MTYSAQPLDELLTGLGTAMTESGTVVGIDEQNRTAWIYRNEGVEFLSHATRELIASAVNESDVVVGHVGEREVARAFLFDTQLRDLQAKLGKEHGRARDISNTGVVVGAIRNLPDPFLAFRYDTSGDALTMIPFAAPLGDEYVSSEAVVVSDDGDLAAGLAWQAFGASPRGFLYQHSTGTTTDLGTAILPRAINNAGQLAGSEWPSGQALTFNIATGTTLLHANSLLVEGMNDAGELVGSMRGGGDLPSAFLSRPGHPAIDLNSEVPSIQGWLVTSTEVTNGGQIIVNARVPDTVSGQTKGRPFILNPV
jgi:hypothetical protein